MSIISDDIRLSEDQGFPHGGLERKLSLAKAGMEFDRRLYADEDETLVGHCDDVKKPSRPAVLSLISSTSTSLISPMSDVFSAGSTACSVSTSSSRFSPQPTHAALSDAHDKHVDDIPDGFPTEVGGMASLDLQEGPYEELQGLDPETAFLGVDGSVGDSSRPCPVTSGSNSCFALSIPQQSTPGLEIEAFLGSTLHTTADQAEIDFVPSKEEPTPPRPFLRRSSYNHLLHSLHPRPRSPHLGKPQQPAYSSSQSSFERDAENNTALSPEAAIPTLAEPQPNRRRALSVASERLRELREELISQSGDSGRLRSGSVSSQDNGPAVRRVESSNTLIEQAARSRSNSASGSVLHGLPAPQETVVSGSTTRTLSSSVSKDSLRTKFANLPTYVTFLREITLELWIDQVCDGIEQAYVSIVITFYAYRKGFGQFDLSSSSTGTHPDNGPEFGQFVWVGGPRARQPSERRPCFWHHRHPCAINTSRVGLGQRNRLIRHLMR